MNKRKLMLALVLGAAMLAAPALAASSQHPIEGDWEAYFPKTAGDTGYEPLVINIKIEGGKMIYHSVNAQNRENPSYTDFTTDLKGTVSPLPNIRGLNKISVLEMDPFNLQFLKMLDDDVIKGEFYAIAPDGNSFVRRGVTKESGNISKPIQEHFRRIQPR